MERNCTLLIHYDAKADASAVAPTEDDLRKDLESNDARMKVRGLKSLILLLLNGQALPKLLMTVIRYCVTTRDHELKKLLSLYWEVVVKYDGDGKLLPEMILVCNAILNDLKHPNHFIRGCTLRFLCRIKDMEILQPLLPTVLENLSHSDAYVRKNAVMVFYTVYKNFPDLAPSVLPDGPETILAALEAETNPTVRRNCFLYLFKHDTELAVQFYQNNIAKVLKFGTDFHFVFLELVRKVCRTSPHEKPRFLKTIFQLLTTTGSGTLSNAIAFEAAWTLISLSSAPTAIRTATSTLIGLLNNAESDNNVKLIVLERLERMKSSSSDGLSSSTKIIQENILEILRVLSAPDKQIRSKALAIAMDLVTPRNIKDIVGVLKKEIVRTQSKEVDKKDADEYRQQLVKAIHECAARYPTIAANVISLLMDFLTDPGTMDEKKAGQASTQSSGGAMEVVLFVREVIETYPKLREGILNRLMVSLPEIAAPDVIRVALWLLGEYSVDSGLYHSAIESIYAAVGNREFTIITSKDETPEEQEASAKPTGGSVAILADGTYATQTAASYEQPESNRQAVGGDNFLSTLIKVGDPPLRKLVMEGNYMLGSCVLSSLMKIILKLRGKGEKASTVNRLVVNCVKFGCSLLTFGRAKELPTTSQIDRDSYERINLYIKVLLDGKVAGEVENILLTESRNNFQTLLNEHKQKKRLTQQKLDRQKIVQPDQVIMFRQLKSGQKLGVGDGLDDENDLSLAVADNREKSLSDDLSEDYRKELKNIYQLTGFGDPVYAETSLTVHGFDIIADVMVINKTKKTLLDLNVDLATIGDLKLVEAPQAINLSAGNVHNFKTSLKVSSTESSQIFGTIVFDDPQTKQSHYINLNRISVDIMDYIKPSVCTDTEFRKMWAEFEWENKVAVHTRFNHLYKFLLHMVKSTNMNCLNVPNLEGLVEDITKRESKHGEEKIPEDATDVDFLAANLYAKSIFGEDALVNVSVEKIGRDKVEGFIRIRAKTQGIALSLGDRINLKQKSKS